MNHWIHRLHLLSLAELEKLKADPEVGPCQPIELEYNIKLLIARLPKLSRDVALVLHNANQDSSGGRTHCDVSDELSRVLIHNKATESLMRDIALMCNEIGLKVLRRGIAKYKASPQYKAVELSSDELFAHLDDNKGGSSNNDPQKTVEAFTEDFPEDDREWLRSHLRDTYGLHSAEDWEHLKQARRCIAEERADLLGKRGHKTARTLSKLAHDLYTTAKANDCSPAEWIEWRKTKALVRDGKVHPGSIINVPGGKQIFGDGEPVRPDSQGRPRRTAIDIFGREVAANEMADVHKIDNMVRNAFEKRPKRNR